ncbi:MAG: DUF7453 family protein [Acidobacteriota bacterium]
MSQVPKRISQDGLPGSPSINNNGAIAFLARTAEASFPEALVLLRSQGRTEMLASQGASFSAFGRTSHFFSLILNDLDSVLFLANLAKDADPGERLDALFFTTLGQTIPLAVEGVYIHSIGATISDIRSFAMNNHNQIVLVSKVKRDLMRDVIFTVTK